MRGGRRVSHTSEREKQIKRQLKLTQEQEIPMNQEFYDRLHDKIMAAVEQVEIQPISRIDSTQQVLKRHWRQWTKSVFSIVVAMVALGSLSWVFSQSADKAWSSSRTVQLMENENLILSEAVLSPEDFSNSSISYQSENDFFVDVALAHENLETLISRAQL